MLLASLTLSSLVILPPTQQPPPSVGLYGTLPARPIPFRTTSNFPQVVREAKATDSATDRDPKWVSVLVFEPLRPMIVDATSPAKSLKFKGTQQLELETALSGAGRKHLDKQLMIQWNILVDKTDSAQDIAAWSLCYKKHNDSNRLGWVSYQFAEKGLWQGTFGVYPKMYELENVIYICDGRRVVKVLKNVGLVRGSSKSVIEAIDEACRKFNPGPLPPQ